jgi:hypothetical protein
VSAAGLLAPLLSLACPDGLIPTRWPATVNDDTVLIAERLISVKTVGSALNPIKATRHPPVIFRNLRMALITHNSVI